MKTILKFVGIIILITLLIFILLLIKVSFQRNKTIEKNAISEIKSFSLGGYDQKVMIEGKNLDSPIIVFLHGGPGSPVPFNNGCRGLVPELTDDYIMVFWDQYGCGMNNADIKDLGKEDFVAMTKDLILNLKEEFPENEVNIFAFSWGSFLAARVSEEIPETINKTVTYGQVVEDLIFSQETYRELENTPKIAAEDLNKAKEMVDKNKKSKEDIEAMYKILSKYTSTYQFKNMFDLGTLEMFLGILSSPDYSFEDKKALIKNGYEDSEKLVFDLSNMEIKENLERIKVPYKIYQGENDLVTNTELVTDFVKNSNNDNLSIEIVPGYGHIPDGKITSNIIRESF